MTAHALSTRVGVPPPTARMELTPAKPSTLGDHVEHAEPTLQGAALLDATRFQTSTAKEGGRALAEYVPDDDDPPFHPDSEPSSAPQVARKTPPRMPKRATVVPTSAPPTTVAETTPTLPERPRLAMLTLAQVLALPDPRWLIRPLLTLGALVVLYGPPGSGKSFVALDWALSIAAQFTQWLGFDIVSPGPIVYVVAEGRGGIRKRLAAWLQEHGGLIDGVFVILEPVQLLDENDINLLLIRITSLRPSLVIFDTFASCFSGDENAPRDMSAAIAAARQVIRETGATVILVHHTGKKGDEERGHSALRAAADAMILLKAKRGPDGTTLLSLTNIKQKEDDPFPEIVLRLKPVSIEASNGGDSATSCVLEVGPTPSKVAEVLSGGPKLALEVLTDRYPSGATKREWMAAIAQRGGIELEDLAERTFHHHREALQKRGLVEAIPGKPPRYRPTEADGALITAPPKDVLSADLGNVTPVNGSDVPVPPSCHSMPTGTGSSECQPPAPPLGAGALAQAPNLEGDRADG
jgi:hypothetical protein